MLSNKPEDLVIELKDDHFHFLMSNLLGHDPIHDFNDTHNFISNMYKKQDKSNIAVNLLEIYQLINKYYLSQRGGVGNEDITINDDILEPASLDYQAIEDKRHLKELLTENSVHILYLVGNLNDEKINELKRQEVNQNLNYLIITEAIKTMPGFSEQQIGGMPPREISQNQELINNGFIDNRVNEPTATGHKRYTHSLTRKTMGLQEAKRFLNITRNTRTRKATKIQDFQRMRKTRKNAAITIQTATRSRKAKNELKKLRNATTSVTEGQIKEEIIRLMINENLESKYDIIDELEEDIENYEKEIEEKELEKENEEDEESLELIDLEIEDIQNIIIELKPKIINIKEPVLDKIDELINLNKDKRTKDEIFEIFRDDVKDKIISIESSTQKKIPNQIVKFFALLGKNINQNIRGSYTNKENELLEKIIDEGGWTEKGKNIDSNLDNYFREIFKSETVKIDEIIEDKDKDKDKKFIITNAAISTKNPYRKNTLGCISSVIDAAGKGVGGIDKDEMIETGDMKVKFTNKEKINFYSLELNYDKDILKLIIEIKLPLTKEVIRINKSINMKGDLKDLSASRNYEKALDTLVNKIRRIKEFKWAELPSNEDFLISFIQSYHVKALGDFIQELNGILKYGGYKYIDNNPSYEDEPNIIRFKKTAEGKEKDGNKFRIFVANDRPSACRYMFLKKVLSEKVKNTKSFGGNYSLNPDKSGNYNYFII